MFVVSTRQVSRALLPASAGGFEKAPQLVVDFGRVGDRVRDLVAQERAETPAQAVDGHTKRS
jgi:hypothetical protein